MQTQDILKKPLGTKWVVVRQNYKVLKETKPAEYLRGRLETVVLVSTQRYKWDDYYSGTWKSEIDNKVFELTTDRNYGFKVTDGTNYRIVTPRSILVEYSEMEKLWAEEDVEIAKKNALLVMHSKLKEECEVGATERAEAVIESYRRVLDKIDNGLGALVTANWFRFSAENFGTQEEPRYGLKPNGYFQVGSEGVMRLLEALMQVEELLENQ